MALRITLKPYERMIINGALIRNGDRNHDFIIETQCKFLRESEIIREEEVDTPCKQLRMTMQVLYLAEDPSKYQALLLQQASEVLNAMPSAAPYISAMSKHLEAGQPYKALKEARLLANHEHTLASQKQGNTDAA